VRIAWTRRAPVPEHEPIRLPRFRLAVLEHEVPVAAFEQADKRFRAELALGSNPPETVKLPPFGTMTEARARVPRRRIRLEAGGV